MAAVVVLVILSVVLQLASHADKKLLGGVLMMCGAVCSAAAVWVSTAEQYHYVAHYTAWASLLFGFVALVGGAVAQAAGGR